MRTHDKAGYPIFKGFKNRRIPQVPSELNNLLAVAGREYVTSYLEIGLRHATTFHWIGSQLPKGSLLVGVDMPGGMWGDREGKGRQYIDEAAKDLISRGYKVQIIYGDSTANPIVKEVRKHGPFDLCFIDGDHRYDAVVKDWNNYGDMSSIVAFHDIDIENSKRPKDRVANYGVPKLWKNLTSVVGRPYAEFIDQEYRGLGIGVIWK